VSSTKQRVVIRSRPSASRLQVGPTPVAKTEAAARSVRSEAFRHIRTAITSISMANAASIAWDEIWSPSQLPIGAVSIPAAAKSNPVRSSTWPYHHRSIAPTSAVAATVTSEMLTAVFGSTPIQ
jgi:hypothetical protein